MGTVIQTVAAGFEVQEREKKNNKVMFFYRISLHKPDER